MGFRDFLLYFTHFNGTVLTDHVNNEARFIIMCGENTGALPPSCGSLPVLQKRGHAVTKTHAVLGWQTVIDNPSFTVQYYITKVMFWSICLYIHIWSYCKRSCKDKRSNYLFPAPNLRIMVDTVTLLMLACTLCSASLIVIPQTRTWSITVAQLSSEITVLCLRSPPIPPRRPLTHTLSPLLRLFLTIVPTATTSAL